MSISSRLLLHCCCGPCATTSIDALRDMGFEITALFFNPNIAPDDEYQRRLDAWKKVCNVKGVESTIREDNSYKPSSGKNRCGHCYYSRFEIASAVTTELRFDTFSTTLSISPYQNHNLIKIIGNKFTGFRYIDLREFYSESKRQAREMGLYSQKYCGCLDSKLEARWMVKSRRERRRAKLGEYSDWQPDCVLDRD